MDAQEPQSSALTLPTQDVSTFCQGMAMLLAAGVQPEEAALLLSQGRGEPELGHVAGEVSLMLGEGRSLAQALERTGAFPAYALLMLSAGEAAGRTEDVLQRLAVYYDEEGRLLAKIRSVVGYPAALLLVMTLILAFTTVVLLPVFTDVYNRLSGGFGASPMGSTASLAIGWVALALTFAAAAVSLAAWAVSGSTKGGMRLMRVLERFPLTRGAMYPLALSRFIAALATYSAAGYTADAAIEAATPTVTHPLLLKRLRQVLEAMTDIDEPLNLVDAFDLYGVMEPVRIRLLQASQHAGNLDATLAGLAATLFDESTERLDQMVDNVEPVLAAFLTVAVGAALVAVMLPLIGIMGSIG